MGERPTKSGEDLLFKYVNKLNSPNLPLSTEKGIIRLEVRWCKNEYKWELMFYSKNDNVRSSQQIVGISLRPGD